MPVIALCNLKGGTGKTTSAIYLATALKRKGLPVKVLDADPQGSASEWSQYAEEEGNALSFSVTPANANTLSRLKKGSSNEWTIIDCPPGDSRIIDSAVSASDLVIVPTRPSSMEATRMWLALDLAKEIPAIVLIVSAIPNTKSLEALREALVESEIRAFRVAIPQRELIKNSFGAGIEGDLQGYASVANELIESFEVNHG